MKLGIDIGGTKTAAVAVDDAGEAVHRVRMPTGYGSTEVVETVARAVAMVEEEAGQTFESIGIGIPGMVEESTGLVRHAVNLGFDQLELGALLSERLGVPVGVENDVKAASLGAYHLLYEQRNASCAMAYLNLGTGVAAGFVTDGRLWRGTGGTAGEIGHIPIDPTGAACACGQRGCIETVASGSAVERLWPSTTTYPAKDLFDAFARGDHEARGVVDRLSAGIAAAVRAIILTLDLDVVVIGGGLSNLGDPLLAEVRRTLDAWGQSSAFIAQLGLADRVIMLPQGLHAAAVGAAVVGTQFAEAFVAAPPSHRTTGDSAASAVSSNASKRGPRGATAAVTLPTD